MITIKNATQIGKMKAAGAVVRDVLGLLEENIKPGVTTARLDQIAYEYITSQGARPSFKGYRGYPATICASVDAEVVHGIPSERVLEEGMIVSIDVGACLDGYHGDAARTFAVGSIDPEKSKLIEVTRECFFKGIKFARAGYRLGDIGAEIQFHAESNGFSVVRALVGHGIGTQMHEDPPVPNFGIRGRGLRLQAGMALAIEPMINAGGYEVEFLPDGWTVRTRDGKPSAHYENTVVITEDEPMILTL